MRVKSVDPVFGFFRLVRIAFNSLFYIVWGHDRTSRLKVKTLRAYNWREGDYF